MNKTLLIFHSQGYEHACLQSTKFFPSKVVLTNIPGELEGEVKNGWEEFMRIEVALVPASMGTWVSEEVFTSSPIVANY